MQTDRSHFFDYMDSTVPPWKWLALILLMSAMAVILFWGLGAGNSFFYTFAFGRGHAGEFIVDPLLSEYIPNKIPLFFKIVSDIYDIPFYHLAFGVFVKGLVVVTYFCLAWKMTRSSFASLIAVLIIFGLLKFEIGTETILNLKLPFVPDSMEFRHWGYLSFRQASAPFIIIGTIFFLGRKFVPSSIFIALAVYCHPHSGMIFFVALNLAFLLCLLFWEKKLAVLKNWVKFSLPFLIIISPYLLSALSTFPDVSPLPFNTFWELTLKNEPDDASTLWSLKHSHQPYLLSFYLTLAALFLHFLYKSKIPKIKLNIKSLIRDDQDMLWPMMLAPWALVGFGYIWESGLMVYLPDFMNDIIALLHIRRVNMVSTILYIPIFSMLLARGVLTFSEKLGWEILGESFLLSLNSRLKKINLASVDLAFAVGFSMVSLLFVLLLKSENIETFKKYWVFDSIGYELGLKKQNRIKHNLGGKIPNSSLIDICNWIKSNTPVSAAFFNPAYIRPFRSCTKRQGFIEEKLDGNFAIADRKFAAIYYKRFADIHRGLTYYYPAIINNINTIMQKRYLSLDGEYIEFLKEEYPGYSYFLTETGHKLPYPVIYKNLHFALYDLTPKFQKTD